MGDGTQEYTLKTQIQSPKNEKSTLLARISRVITSLDFVPAVSQWYTLEAILAPLLIQRHTDYQGRPTRCLLN